MTWFLQESVLKPVLPVVANEILWSMGITAYSVVYARISTDAIAAMNIVNSIDQMALVPLQCDWACMCVLVGNRIGAGEEDQAFRYAARSEALGIMGAAWDWVTYPGKLEFDPFSV